GKPLKAITPRRRKIVIYSVTAAVVLVGGLFVGFDIFRGMMIKKGFDSFKFPAPVVSASVVQSGELIRRMAGIGSLSSVNQISIAPEISGRVQKIMFEAGRYVQKGEPLVQLDDSQERAALAQFTSQQRLAKLTLGRNKTLADRQFSSQATLDQLTSGLEIAEANIQNTQAQIDHKLIRAPFSGQLGVRQVEVGQVVQPGNVLVTLTDLSQLYVNFTVPDQMRSAIQVGQTLLVSSNSVPGEKFPARLQVIEPQVDVNTRQISLQAVMTNPGRKLLPGMFVDVLLNIKTSSAALTVPETAIARSLNGETVYRITKSDGSPLKASELPAIKTAKPANAADKSAADAPTTLKVERILVKIGDTDNGRIEIVSGLNDGDVVVESGQNRLFDHAEVIISGAPSVLVPPSETPKP
ncbi:MAG: efflux RND transporter periplasmic adaptor subunit, partial [Alphaproteobacteria bacterium]|nr:efflux RND transporter periplasmic adaptor subunit [Alphaproteobacteria bacterium]